MALIPTVARRAARPAQHLGVVLVRAGRVERRDRLGGLIHEYSRGA